MCSDLQTRETKWVSAADNAKNGHRSSYDVSWGVPTAIMASVYASPSFGRDVPPCPVSGWRSTQWG